MFKEKRKKSLKLNHAKRQRSDAQQHANPKPPKVNRAQH